MIEQISKVAIRIGLILIAITTLSIVGNGINAILPWQYLEVFFAIIKSISNIFSFIWDINTLWLLVGLSFTIQVFIWLWKATSTIINFFNEK